MGGWGREFQDTGFGNDLLDMIPKAQGKKRQKIGKWDYIELKNFCAAKETVPRKWKIFQCYQQNVIKYLQIINLIRD